MNTAIEQELALENYFFGLLGDDDAALTEVAQRPAASRRPQ